jgi:hypothetical protein
VETDFSPTRFSDSEEMAPLMSQRHPILNRPIPSDPSKVRASIFTSQKPSNRPEENEDHFFRPELFTFVLMDGATSSYAAQLWNASLESTYVTSTRGNLQPWLSAAAADYEHKFSELLSGADPKKRPFMKSAFMKQPSASCFLELCLKRGREEWHAEVTSIGDCEIWALGEGGFFPLISEPARTSRPGQLRSDGEVVGEVIRMQWQLPLSMTLFLHTDGFSGCFRRNGDGTPDTADASKVASMSKSELKARIQGAVSSGLAQPDDVTLVMVTLR